MIINDRTLKLFKNGINEAFRYVTISLLQYRTFDFGDFN